MITIITIIVININLCIIIHIIIINLILMIYSYDIYKSINIIHNDILGNKIILPNGFYEKRYDWVLRGNSFDFTNRSLTASFRVNIHYTKSCSDNIYAVDFKKGEHILNHIQRAINILKVGSIDEISHHYLSSALLAFPDIFSHKF